jgi:hypothetical protein
MGGAAYPDDWDGWLYKAETRIVECTPKASAARSGPSEPHSHRAGQVTFFLPNSPQLPSEGEFGRKNVRKTGARTGLTHGFIVANAQQAAAALRTREL